MMRPAIHRAFGKVAKFGVIAALLVLTALSGGSVCAQPFRAYMAPLPSPPLEARQSFQAKLDEQARLLAGHPHLRRITPDKRQTLVEFVVGNLLFVTARELGQAVVSEIGLPLLGGSEQAFDDFAVLTELDLAEKSFSDRILIEGVKGWLARARRGKAAKGAPDYFDQHGLSMWRAYRVACLMFGADAARFGTLPDETALPRDRRRGCGGDYDKVSKSWSTALAPHRPAADQPRARIEASYGAATGDLTVYAQVLRNLRFLETIAEFAADRLAWRSLILIELQSCGKASAAWTASTRTLRLCYEMAKDFAELYRDFGRDP